MTRCRTGLPPPILGYGELTEWAAQGRRRRHPRKQSRTISNKAFARYIEETKQLLKDGNWADSHPGHYVALYFLLHEAVYGVSPIDLTSKDRKKAFFLASRLLKLEFADDKLEMVGHMKWAWSREEQREKWRRSNGRAGSRITWYRMFNGSLLTEYRIDKARHR